MGLRLLADIRLVFEERRAERISTADLIHRLQSDDESPWGSERAPLTPHRLSRLLGPFEISPGSQFDDGRGWNHQMFPPREAWPHYAEEAVRKYPRMGDISCRSALTIHRGTAHPSPISRPVLVLGVDAPGAGHAALHDMMVTPAFHESLPAEIRRRLACRVVDDLVPITQKHDIEGLVMGAD